MTQVQNFNFPGSPWSGEVGLPAIRDMIHALRADNAGPNPPLNPVPFMRWRKTSAPVGYFVRDAANQTWIALIDDLGGTTVGKAVFTAANVQAALLALGGTEVGRSLFAAASAAAAQSIIGGSAVGREVFVAISTLAARAAIGAPAVPTNVAGFGQITSLFQPDGTALALGGGGTWLYFVLIFNPATGGYASHVAAVAAGGTTITGTAGIKAGMAWRIT